MLDPVGKVLVDFYRDKFARFGLIIGTVLTLLGAIPLIYTVLELVFKYPKEEAFWFATVIYIGLFMLGIVIYGTLITWSLFQEPMKVIEASTKLDDLTNEFLGKLYGLEKTKAIERIRIKSDGSYSVKSEITLTAKTPHLRAIELYAEILSPVSQDVILPNDKFRITPQEFGPISTQPIQDMKGWFEIRFSKDLPTDRPVILEHEEEGGVGSFAIDITQYPTGLNFDYAARNIFYPTRHLIVEIEFEDGFPLSLVRDRPRASVWYGTAQVEHAQETWRANRYLKFKGRKALLELPNPVLGLDYIIRWSVE